MINFDNTYINDDEFDLDDLADTIGTTGFEYWDGNGEENIDGDEPKELNF